VNLPKARGILPSKFLPLHFLLLHFKISNRFTEKVYSRRDRRSSLLVRTITYQNFDIVTLPAHINYCSTRPFSQEYWMVNCLYRNHRHRNNIDCLMAHTACLVCFISTVNGRSKKLKKKRRSLGF
jgi:hypothetical protein